jgi:hypothetical protein
MPVVIELLIAFWIFFLTRPIERFECLVQKVTLRVVDGELERVDFDDDVLNFED